MRRPSLLALAVLVACRSAPAPLPDRVVVAYPSGAATLLPFASNEEFNTSILSNVYETLVELDHSLGISPNLAQSWRNPDDLTWIFQIRHDVKLHDGRTLEARHVAESLDIARRDPRSKRQAELLAVETITAADSHTLVVRTRFPFGPLPNRLAHVPIFAGAADGSGTLVGTGSYRIRSHDASGETALEVFPSHWRGRPAVNNVIFRVMPALDLRLAALSRGEVHLAVDVPPQALAAQTGQAGVGLVSRKGLRVLFLGMDCARAVSPDIATRANPFRDLRVRRAVALAVDREALVSGPLLGFAETAEQVIAPEVFGYHEGLPRVARNLPEARRLMTEAGYAKGFEVPLDFMPGKYRAGEAVVAALGSQLAEAGIRIRPRPFDARTFLDRVETQQPAFYLMGWLSNSGDAGLSYEYLVHTPGNGFGQDNGGGYSNPAVDALLEQASGRLRSEQRKASLREAAELLQQEAPLVPLYRQTDVYGVAQGLQFRPRLDRRINAAALAWMPR